MKQTIAKWLAGTSGQTGTLLVLTAMGVLTYLGQSIYALVWLHQTWQPFDFASGFGAMMAASAGGLGLHVNLRAGQNRVATGDQSNNSGQ